MYCRHFFAAQSDVPLDIQEVDKSVAVVSYTPPDAEVSQLSLCPRCTHTCLCKPTSSVPVDAVCVHVYTCTLHVYWGEVTICCVACCSRSCFQLFKGVLVYVRN